MKVLQVFGLLAVLGFVTSCSNGLTEPAKSDDSSGERSVVAANSVASAMDSLSSMDSTDTIKWNSSFCVGESVSSNGDNVWSGNNPLLSGKALIAYDLVNDEFRGYLANENGTVVSKISGSLRSSFPNTYSITGDLPTGAVWHAMPLPLKIVGINPSSNMYTLIGYQGDFWDGISRVKYTVGIQFKIDTANPDGTVQVLRGHSKSLPDHIYTTSYHEWKNCGQAREGIAFSLWPDSGNGLRIPLYRLSSDGHHHYTTNNLELYLCMRNGWKLDSILGYVYGTQGPGTVPLYRVYHAGKKDHMFTVNLNEALIAQACGWVNEGIACYVNLPFLN